jgi:hypothetical protein
MHSGQKIKFLVLLIPQGLKFANFRFQCPHTLFKRLGITAGKCTTTEFVACAAFEADVGAL